MLAGTHESSAQPTIPFKSRELKEGRNFVQKLISTPEVSESSGNLSHSYPIQVPEGRGLTPTVSLQYASSAGYSEFGLGWDLTIPTIERSQRNGVPRYTADSYRFKDGHSTIELVPTGITTPLGGTEYRERVERTFSRYLRYGNQWRILRPNGVRLELGTTASSRRGVNVTLGLGGTAAWLVDRIVNTNGNFIIYEYENDLVQNPQIRRIRYTGNVNANLDPMMSVEFIWETNTAATRFPESHRSGYRRQFGKQRLAQIDVVAPRHGTVASPSLAAAAQVPESSPEVRTYLFGHQRLDATVNNLFYLTSAQIKDFPATVFFYSDPDTGGVNDVAMTLAVVGQDFPGHLGLSTSDPDGAGKTRSVLADVTGDGLPDLIDASSCESWKVWRNTGLLLIRESWPAPLDLTADRIPDPCALRVTANGNTLQNFLDLDGDSLPDLVYAVSGGVVKWCPGNGTGFGTCGPYGHLGAAQLRTSSSPSSTVDLTTSDMLDMNADGRPDLVKVSGGQLLVSINAGPGFAFVPLAPSAAPPCPYLTGLDCLRASELALVPNGNRRLFADVRDINGDGLPDYLYNDYTTNELFISHGNGRQFSPAETTGTFFSLGVGFQATAGGGYTAREDLVDMNGDGMADFVRMNCAQSTYSVRFNIGGVWDSTERTYTISTNTASFFSACLNTERPSEVDGRGASVTIAQFSDLTGDGIADFVSAPINADVNRQLLVRRTNYAAPRLLSAVTSLGGHHRVDVVYAPQIGQAPTPIHAVGRLDRQRTPLYPEESARQTLVDTIYNYDQGVFDRSERRFMGFRRVTGIGPEWATTSVSIYGVTVPQEGLLLERTVTNNRAQGSPERTINIYTSVILGADHWFARHDRTESRPSPGRTLATDYFDYTPFGKPRVISEQGDVNKSDDDRQQVRTYVVRNDEEFILEVASQEHLAAFLAVLGATSYAYDGLGFGAAPREGNTTRVLRSIDTNRSAGRSFLFDNIGNLIKETDELGFETTFEYDPTYRQFQIAASSSLGTVARSYHALTGIAADECGPQTASGTSRCSRAEVDVLGRAIASYVPTLADGTYSKALLATVAYDDDSYPFSTTVTQRGVSHSIEYRDGFGNPTQLRVEEFVGVYRVFETGFDGFGRPLRVELPYRETVSAYAHRPISTEAWTYDNDYVHQTIERVTHPREPGDLSLPATVSRVILADAIVATDEDGLGVRYILDGHQRVVQVDRTTPFAPGNSIQFARTVIGRDRLGRIVSLTDPNGQITRYAYNFAGWPEFVTAPDGQFTAFFYDDRGQVTGSVDPRGVMVVNAYDEAGRIVATGGFLGGPDVRPIDERYTYYPSSESTQFGWLESESSNGITQRYAYNAEGLVSTHEVRFGDSSGVVEFDHDVGGLLKGITYPDGYRVRYHHYLDDAISSILGGVEGQTLASYLYQDDGQVSTITSDFGLEESHGYDARGRRNRVISTNTQIGSGDLVDDELQFSKSSQVRKLTRRGLRPGAVARQTPDVFTMSPDPFGRLARVNLNGQQLASYTYDIGGRITSFHEPPLGEVSHSTFDGDRLIRRSLGFQTRELTYDFSGNVVHDRTRSGTTTLRSQRHAWDALGRYAKTLDESSDASVEYYYTPRNALALVTNPRSQPGAQVLYLGSLARKNLSSGAWTDSIVANGVVVAEHTAGRIQMPHRTLLRTVGAVSNDVGEIVRQEEFTPYGSRLAGSSSGSFEQHFHGLRTDFVSVAGTRGYDSTLGVWLARDRLPQSDPESVVNDSRLLELYGFNFGTPYDFRDPTGKDPVSDLVAGRVDSLISRACYPCGVYLAARNALDGNRDASDRILHAINIPGAATPAGGLGDKIAAFVDTAKDLAGQRGLVHQSVAGRQIGAMVVLGVVFPTSTATPKAVARSGAPFGGLSRAAEFGLKPYAELQKTLKGTGLHAHHLIEKRFAGVVGQNARQMLSVAVTPAEHQTFTNRWHSLIGYGKSGTGAASPEDVTDAARKVYASYPEILKALGL